MQRRTRGARRVRAARFRPARAGRPCSGPRRTPSVSTKLADIDFRAIVADMAADGLPFGQRLDPGGRERRGLDAEAGIDHAPAARPAAWRDASARDRAATGRCAPPDAMLSTRTKTRSRRRAPMPRASRSRHSISQSLSMMRFRSSGSPTGSAKRSSARGTSGGIERGQRFLLRCRAPDRGAAARSPPNRRLQAGARLAGELRHALDADVMQRRDDVRREGAARRPAGWRSLPRRGPARRCRRRCSAPPPRRSPAYRRARPWRRCLSAARR